MDGEGGEGECGVSSGEEVDVVYCGEEGGFFEGGVADYSVEVFGDGNCWGCSVGGRVSLVANGEWYREWNRVNRSGEMGI